MLRRTTRSTIGDNQNEPPKSSPKASPRKRKDLAVAKDDKVNLSGCRIEPLGDELATKTKTLPFKQRKRVARNVGGWISPDFSEKIDRSWLQELKAQKSFELSKYVPQVGDIVL
jgi:hypothetical protein